MPAYFFNVQPENCLVGPTKDYIISKAVLFNKTYCTDRNAL